MNTHPFVRFLSSHWSRTAARVVGAIILGVVGLMAVFLAAGCSKQSATAPMEGRLSSTEPCKGVTAPISLARHYNAGHQTNWLGGGKVPGRDLAELPEGRGTYGGVPFDVRGVIQLRGMGDRKYGNLYPEAVDAIPVRGQCAKLHFLHATAWSTASGTRIASYVVHYADNTELRLQVFYGDDLRDYTYEPSDETKAKGAAWSSITGRYPKRVFRSTWVNPNPNVQVKEIDFISTGSRCYPFLLAITAEQL